MAGEGMTTLIQEGRAQSIIFNVTNTPQEMPNGQLLCWTIDFNQLSERQ